MYIVAMCTLLVVTFTCNLYYFPSDHMQDDMLPCVYC